MRRKPEIRPLRRVVGEYFTKGGRAIEKLECGHEHSVRRERENDRSSRYRYATSRRCGSCV